MPRIQAVELEWRHAAEARSAQDAAHARVYPHGCPEACASCRHRLGIRGSAVAARRHSTLVVAGAVAAGALAAALVLGAR